MKQNAKVVIALPPSTVPTSSPLKLPPRLFVPLPSDVAENCLNPGTRVTRGQALIAPIAGDAYVPLAPAVGTVVRTLQVQLLDGRTSAAVEIDVDPSGDTAADAIPSTTSPPADLHALIDRVRRCGVTATRHTSPDLLGQLREATGGPMHHLICNLLDVDGGSSLHSKVIRENGSFVIDGVVALAQALGSAKAWIAAAPGLSNRVSVLVRKANAISKIKVVTIENDYPQSDPTLLVYALTGRRLQPAQLPTSVKAVVLDGVAASAVGRSVAGGEALLTVPVEIRDSTRARSHVALAAVGTPLAHVLASMGLNAAYTFRAGAASARCTPGC